MQHGAAFGHGGPIAAVILGVIDDSIFAAFVLMIFVTTLAAPPMLEIALSRQTRRAQSA